MHHSRRTFMKLAGALSSTLALAGCGSPYTQLAGSPALPAVALGSRADFQRLNRLTFGPRLVECNDVAEIGVAHWLEEQLAPTTLDDGDCDFRLRGFNSLTLDAATLFDLYGDKLFDEQDRTTVPNELRQATLIRRLYSRRQIYEVLVEFWSDHFHLSVDKGDCFYLKTVDDREVIRPHALGNFGDLLWASAHSPAMLVYLDNQANQRGQPNENYARELLELHTLGVHGGYTQADVMNLARCLTGWGVKEHFWRGQFTFDATRHDTDDKVVLGQLIVPAGQQEAEGVIEQLARHPATARFVTTKLARRFLGDEPPPALVQRAAAAFTQSRGDIPTVLRVLLLDGLATGQPLTPKFKRPVNFVLSALRQLNANSDAGQPVLDFLARMGQPLFAWPTPDGFPDRNADWLNNLLPRWQFALALARNEITGTTIDPALLGVENLSPAAALDRLSLLLLGGEPATPLRNALVAAATTVPATETLAVLLAGLLAAPAFQWR